MLLNNFSLIVAIIGMVVKNKTPLATMEYIMLQLLSYIHADVLFFRKWLGRYRLEHIQAKSCPAEKDLGLILVDTRELKSQLLPSPLQCLEILYEVLPFKAKTMMESLIQISQDAVIKLEGEPVTTIDFVNVLKYDDNILYLNTAWEIL